MLRRMPGSYALLFYIILILGILSYFVPAGTYDREVDIETGISYVVSDSYEEIESSPVSVFDVFKAIPQGLMEASDIIIFVLIAGGSFGVIQSTGTTSAVIGSLTKKSLKNNKVLIIVIMSLFSLSGALFGTAEEALPFYPLVVALALAMGYDRLTGVAIVLLGTGTGFAAGFLNPFTTGIAQNISNLPLYSGILLRVFSNIIFLMTAIVFLFRHMKSIKRDNVLTDVESEGIVNFQKIERKHIYVSLVLFLSFLTMVIGIAKYNFYMLEIATMFLIMAILSGLVSGLGADRISSEFLKGAANMTFGALIIGLSKGVIIIMEYGNIVDTVIYSLSRIIEGFSPIISSIGMFFVHSVLNIFISSGSGQAAATMTIMKTIADLSNVTRQTAVLAFQFGDGLTNMISPTSGYFIAALAIGNIEWKDWVKWFLPLFVLFVIEAILILILATIIGYGPY